MVRLTVWAITFVLLSVVALGTEGSPKEEIFVEAGKAYKEGRFLESAAGYGRLLEYQPENARLYFNLGNAYFKAGELGRAILAFERARILIPRDEDLRFNLRYALDRTQDSMPEPEGFLSKTYSWLETVTFHELVEAFLLFNVLLWGIMILRIFSKQEWSSFLCAVLLLLWVSAGFLCGLKWHLSKADNRAVILEKEVSVIASPSEKDTTLFKLHEGTTVNVEREEEGWVLIRVSDGKRGWMKSCCLERIVLQDRLNEARGCGEFKFF